jgi:hypothetical protein
MADISFRAANVEDIGLIREYIRELAEYENMVEEFVATD